MAEQEIRILNVPDYDEQYLFEILSPSFFKIIIPGNLVVIKPNWVSESRKDIPDEWEQIITHPLVTKVVLRRVVEKLQGKGKVIITDGPQTDSSLEKILSQNDINEWKKIAGETGIELEIIDLRDEEWISDDGIVLERKKLKGDPRGKTLVNLRNHESEFRGHLKSKMGYYGAYYDSAETNVAHDGKNNLYSVSKSVLEADVFINLPKLKTHKKAGITCSLKNLVGINTEKNFLPHYNMGSANEGGDQFPVTTGITKIESHLVPFVKQHFLQKNLLAKAFSVTRPAFDLVFGKNDKKIRSGNWYGNDTLWRTVLDLNKILFYANPDGSMREDDPKSRKNYISIVDAVISGEGEGPLNADRKETGFIVVGYNPAAVDMVCADLMGFDWEKIPIIRNSFNIKNYKFADFNLNDIAVNLNGKRININELNDYMKFDFVPPFGWKTHIEK